jgi:CRISPR-associated protein Cas1
LAARAETLVVWVGEMGVRLYAAGQPCGARSHRLLFQSVPRLDESARLKVLRKKMYSMRFGEDAPERRSVEQLRGMEGARVERSVSFMRVKMP